MPAEYIAIDSSVATVNAETKPRCAIGKMHIGDRKSTREADSELIGISIFFWDGDQMVLNRQGRSLRTGVSS